MLKSTPGGWGDGDRERIRGRYWRDTHRREFRDRYKVMGEGQGWISVG